MARVFRREMLPGEDVTEVRAAVIASNFGAQAVGIQSPGDRTGNFVIETGPATAGIEFVFGAVKFGTTLPTDICAGALFVVIFAGKRSLRALIYNHAFFLGSEWV